MLSSRLIYLALIIGSGLFVILYVDSLSLLLFLVVLALPVLMFLLLLLARVLTRITVELDRQVATVGEAVPLRFHIRNLSFVALPGIRAKVLYSGGFLGGASKNEITFPLNAMTKQTVTCDLESDHIGVVKLSIGDIILQDYLRLFSLKIKVRQEYEVTFMPEILPAQMDLRPNTLMNDDSDVFSKTKKGDDPSEVFAIRDYVGGDKLNRIHWKLSSKADTLMVKDYSLPINNKVVLLLELGAPEGEKQLYEVDAVVQAAISISNFLCEAEILHDLCWYDAGSERFFNEEIKDRDDMYAALGMILASKLGSGTDSFAFWSRERKSCSHMAYFTAFANESVLAQFSELSYTTFYTLFQVCEGEGATALEVPLGVQLLPVVYDQVSDALMGVSL